MPPVEKSQDNEILKRPHVMLTQIMRQAAESDIVRISNAIREGAPLHPYKGHDMQVISHKEFDPSMYRWADQVLCAKNETRNAINTEVRKMLGFNPNEIQDGDRVICLRNYWDDYADNGDPLVNGTLGEVKGYYKTFHQLPGWTGKSKIDIANFEFYTDGDTIFDIDADERMLITGRQTLTDDVIGRLTSKRQTANLVPLDFALGYAITYWKAQGSEWDNVLIFEEDFPFNKEEHRKALYTAVTRTARKCVLVLNDRK